ncbi:unnamed protein product [Periconia digitata]|uniref:GH16 domain-containing protein n=1 Tax=Periconia digitata TaxID=1303443 RepID=A0A9W4UHL0_9PLEO|nr:unnamed protein product [Periconia digitata]
MYTSTLLAGAALISSTVAQAPYGLKWNFNSTNFFDEFQFVESPDTAFTNGFANYVGQDEAVGSGLAKIANNKVRLGVDTTNTYAASSTGRKSVRLQSWGYFDNGLLVADFEHVPAAGCGMWPAFWVYQGETSATYSEIDILENVNRESRNSHSFYTSEATCSVNRVIPSTSERTENCHYDGGDGQGCSYSADAGTFGQGFNDGYKVIALQVEEDGIKIWHFKKGQVPADLSGNNPAPQSWSQKPSVHLTPKNCDFRRAWRMFHVVINITFCGGWAGDEGGMWANKGSGDKSCRDQTGQGSCKSWVGGNPSDFKNTYFEFNNIKLFQRP